MTRELEKDGEVTAEALGAMCVDSASVVVEDAPETTVSKAAESVKPLEGLTSDGVQGKTVGSPQPVGAACKHK